MLIYNSKKEFIGIDENDLNILGFSSFTELMNISTDFADMFVKEPGFVHNFQHVSWIDFIACADPYETQRAIIKTNLKSFICTLNLETAYLSDTPSSKAYLINLSDIKEMSADGNYDITPTIPKKPKVQIEKKEIFKEPQELQDIQKISEEQKPKEIEKVEKVEKVEEIQEEFKPLDLNFDDEIIEEPIKEKTIKKVQPEEKIVQETYDNGYVYDPHVASDELGLPIDLIEEFIEDFIAQAKEFKNDLYLSLENKDNANVKTLSHKLKGVAANLRVEDALETLITINTSDDDTEIKTNLDIFYKIISKLSGEKITVTKTEIAEETPILEDEIKIDFKDDSNKIENIQKTDVETIDDEDEFFLEFKDENDDKQNIVSNVQDSEVPEKIDVPELADDEFLMPHEDLEIDTSIDLETISDEETLSLENQSIEIDDIELLDEKNEITDVETNLNTISYDKELIAHEIGLSQNEFQELFDDYIQETQELSALITKAIEKNDSQQWQKSAIQLKGMSEHMRVTDFKDDINTILQTDDSKVANNANNNIKKIITIISK